MCTMVCARFMCFHWVQSYNFACDLFFLLLFISFTLCRILESHLHKWKYPSSEEEKWKVVGGRWNGKAQEYQFLLNETDYIDEIAHSRIYTSCSAAFACKSTRSVNRNFDFWKLWLCGANDKDKRVNIEINLWNFIEMWLTDCVSANYIHNQRARCTSHKFPSDTKKESECSISKERTTLSFKLFFRFFFFAMNTHSQSIVPSCLWWCGEWKFIIYF